MPQTDAGAQRMSAGMLGESTKEPLQLSCLTRGCTDHATSLQPNRAHVYLVGAQKASRLQGSARNHYASMLQPARIAESREVLAMTILSSPVRKQKTPHVHEGSHERYIWRPRTLLQPARITARVDIFADARARARPSRIGLASIFDESDFARHLNPNHAQKYSL